MPEVTLPPITYRNLDLPLNESLQRYLNSADYKLVTAYLLYGERYLKSEKFTELQIRAAPYLSKDYTIIQDCLIFKNSDEGFTKCILRADRDKVLKNLHDCHGHFIYEITCERARGKF